MNRVWSSVLLEGSNLIGKLEVWSLAHFFRRCRVWLQSSELFPALKCYDCELFSRISQKYPLVESFEFLFMFMCIARNPKKNNTNISLLFWSNAGKNVASKKLGPNFFLLTMTDWQQTHSDKKIKTRSRSFEPPKIQKTATKGYELIIREKTTQS